MSLPLMLGAAAALAFTTQSITLAAAKALKWGRPLADTGAIEVIAPILVINCTSSANLVLPNPALVPAGTQLLIVSLPASVGTVTLKAYSTTTIASLAPGDAVLVTLTTTTGDPHVISGVSSITGGANTWTALQTFSAGAALKDSVSYFYDNTDTTKKVAFQVSGVTTGTTRTLTVPDADGTLALLSLAQSWSAAQTFAAAVVLASTLVSTPSSAQDISGNGQTIALPTAGITKIITAGSARTGTILAAGTVDGQMINIVNANASGGATVAFDIAPATSRVAPSVCALPAAFAKQFIWYDASALWFPIG